MSMLLTAPNGVEAHAGKKYPSLLNSRVAHIVELRRAVILVVADEH